MGNGYRKCWTPSNKEAVIDLDFTMTTSNLHLDVDVWLKHLELDSYYSLFKNYAGVEEMLLLSERDLKDLGIKNGSHRAIIATSLVILRDKYEKGHQNKSGLKNSIRKSRSCDSSPRESWTSRGRQNRASWNSMKESNQTGNHPLSSPIRTSSGAEVFDEDNQKACNIASLHRKSSFPCSHVIGHNTSATDSNTSTLQKKSSGRTTGQDQKSFSNNALSLLNNSDDVGHQQDQCSTGLPPLPVKTSAILEKVEANSKIPLDNVPSLARRSLVSKHCQQQQLNYINSSLQRESLINVNKKTTEDEQQAIYINSIGPSSDAMKTKDDKTSVKVQTSDQINKNDQVKNGTDTKVNGFEIYTKSGSENASIVLELSSENYNNQKIPLRASQQSERSPLATTLTKENKSIVCSSCPGILSKIGDDGIGAVNPYKDTKTYHNTIIDNLHSYPWYHGAISRQKAEQLVVKNGDFLIRDCNSRAGSYVLTTWWNGQPLHFVIDKVENLHKLSYRFADGNYDSIYELVRNLMETRKRLSLASDAVLTHPVTRSSCQGSRGNLDYFSKNHGSSNEVPCLPPKKTPLCKHETPSTDLRYLANINYDEGSTSTAVAKHTQSLHSISNSEDAEIIRRDSTNGWNKYGPKSNHLLTETEDFEISPKISPNTFSTPNQDCELVNRDHPPPKPSRIPSIKYAQNPRNISSKVPYDSLGKDITMTEKKFQTLPSKSTTLCKSTNNVTSVLKHNANPEAMTSQLFQETGKNIPSLPPFLPAKLTNSDGGYVRKLSVPDKNPTSVFCLSTFSTVLLIPENKPLDSLSKVKVSTLLKNNEAKTLAIHLTKNDLDVLKYTNDYDLGLGVRNGLELLTLPQGEQLRIDLIERSECLKYLVAVTILTSESSLERAELVSKWIGVAVDCKTSLGNLYGFSGIMKGLSLPQISRLQNTWLVLRQNFTENAVIYESKMRPFLKSLEINPETEVLNSCIPYIMCLISVLQRHLKVSKLTERPPEIETNSKDAQPVTSVMLPWEYTTADYGLQMLMNHLELGRMVAREIDTYQKKCKTYMNNNKYDDQLLDLFRTEFHLKFLWGTKGAKALSDDRYSKLEQVLSLLSQNREAS